MAGEFKMFSAPTPHFENEIFYRDLDSYIPVSLEGYVIILLS